MTKPVMSDAEIKRRKKLQGTISRTTSTLGLASLGMLAASTKAKKPGAYSALKKVPALSRTKSPAEMQERLKGAALNTGVVSSGIGGVGGYNFAAYTAAESRKKKAGMTTVKKSHEGLSPTFGEEGIAKNWSPTASKFDPEGKRMKRTDQYPKVLASAAGVTGAAAAHEGLKAVAAGNQTSNKKPSSRAFKRLSATQASAAKSGKRLGVLTAGLAGGAAYAHKVKHAPETRPYVSKSLNTSAFGINHED